MNRDLNRRTRRRSGLVIGMLCAAWLSPVFLLCLAATASAQSPSWPQWGGAAARFQIAGDGAGLDLARRGAAPPVAARFRRRLLRNFG
jgi:hypothetical protein